MNTVKNAEKAGRQMWLAGLGAVLFGKEYAVDKFDEMFEGTNSLMNQVVSKGQEIEGELKGKFSGRFSLSNRFPQNEKIAELREKLGLNQESKQDKISRLAVKVDALAEIVAAISVKAEKQKAEAVKKSATVASAKTEPKVAAPKPATATATARKANTAARKPRAATSATTAKKPATSRTSATVAKATGSTASKTEKE